MKRPPRDPEEKLFSMVLVTRSLAQGCLAFAAIGGLYLAGLLHGLEHDTLRTMTFTALVATIMTLVFASRAFSASLRHAFVRNNKTFRYVAMFIVGGTLIILTVPFFRDEVRSAERHGSARRLPCRSDRSYRLRTDQGQSFGPQPPLTVELRP